MTTVSITNAAKLTRVSRGTIYNKIDCGELSKSPDGIDTAELLRVFGRLYDPETTANDDSVAANDKKSADSIAVQRQAATATADILQTRLDAADKNAEWLQAMVDKQEKQLAEYQAKLDDRERFWVAQVSQLTASLPAPTKRRRFLGIF